MKKLKKAPKKIVKKVKSKTVKRIKKILKPEVKEYIVDDKKLFCKKCNWTCVVFSKYMTDDESVINDLGHLEKRGLKNEMD